MIRKDTCNTIAINKVQVHECKQYLYGTWVPLLVVSSSVLKSHSDFKLHLLERKKAKINNVDPDQTALSSLIRVFIVYYSDKHFKNQISYLEKNSVENIKRSVIKIKIAYCNYIGSAENHDFHEICLLYFRC